MLGKKALYVPLLGITLSEGDSGAVPHLHLPATVERRAHPLPQGLDRDRQNSQRL